LPTSLNVSTGGVVADETDKTGQQGSGTQTSVPAADSLDTPVDRLKKILTAGSHLLHDPFSDVTRERQGYLLIASVLTLCISRAFISIDKVEMGGVDFQLESANIAFVFAAATGYLAILFAVGAFQEILSARYEIHAGMVELGSMFQEAVSTPAKLAADFGLAEEKRAAFTKEWEAATAEWEQATQKIDAEIKKLEEPIERAQKAIDSIDAKIKERPQDYEKLEPEKTRAREDFDKITGQKDELFGKRAAVRVQFERKQARIKKNHGAKARNEGYTAMARVAVTPLTDKSPEHALDIAKRSALHLKLRLWVEIAAPLLFAAYAIYYGLNPLPLKTPIRTPVQTESSRGVAAPALPPAKQ
jgi:hypothetical protein